MSPTWRLFSWFARTSEADIPWHPLGSPRPASADNRDAGGTACFYCVVSIGRDRQSPPACAGTRRASGRQRRHRKSCTACMADEFSRGSRSKDGDGLQRLRWHHDSPLAVRELNGSCVAINELLDKYRAVSKHDPNSRSSREMSVREFHRRTGQRRCGRSMQRSGKFFAG